VRFTRVDLCVPNGRVADRFLALPFFVLWTPAVIRTIQRNEATAAVRPSGRDVVPSVVLVLNALAALVVRAADASHEIGSFNGSLEMHGWACLSGSMTLQRPICDSRHA
jgi:hypothetical protein